MKNTEKLGKIPKVRKNTLENQEKQKKKGPIFGEKIRKNTENQEKYFEKLGKILKNRKNTSKNQEKQFRKKFGSQEKY